MNTTKDPRAIRRGVAGAKARWGAPHLVRLTELEPAQAAIVLALVEVMKKGPAAVGSPAGPEIGGSCDVPDRA